MEVTQQCVVALTWTLKDTLGEELDVLDEPVEFLVGGNDLLSRVEQALQGHTVGDRLQLHLEPEDAFGDYDEEKVFLEPRALFPKDLEEGMTIDGHALPQTSIASGDDRHFARTARCDSLEKRPCRRIYRKRRGH